MRSLVVLTLVLTACAGAASAGSPPPVPSGDSPGAVFSPLWDPVFGISYDPNKVHFDPVPHEANECLASVHRKDLQFLFGEMTHSGTKYYLVHGWLENASDEPPRKSRRFSSDLNGLIVVIDPDGCHVVNADGAWGPATGAYRPGAPFRVELDRLGVTREVLSALIADAIAREAAAFGGKAELLRKVDALPYHAPESLPDAVREALQHLRREVPHSASQGQK